MEDEVTRLPSSPREDPSSPEVALPPIEREGETIMSACPGEVAFHEDGFQASLRLPIHPSIRMILHSYICLAQLVPNAWRSIVCTVVLWQYHKRISLKKLAQKVDESKSESSAIKPTLAKGAVIGKKRSREESSTSPRKKGKAPGSLKGKETVPPFEAKKEDSGGLIPLSNKEKVVKLTMVTKFFHTIGQQAVVLESCLAVRTKEAGDEVTLQQGQAIDELTKMKDDQDATEDRLENSEILVVELRQNVARSKKLTMEEFKSSNEFQDAVEATTSKYFCVGFDFCKRQLHRHHLDLAIDVEGMGLNYDLFDDEEEKELEEKQEKENEDKKGEKEKKEGEGTSPFSP
ncbi:hypothetical protein Acr_04g0002350 [Actinidia rufa]|uniref:Uncharacterized protein n=1 Tax=Actinidia rufa TaxID=165716 RepID=A0A7J0EIN6_9ERIC|nr:hypothetical protein Acr_04g0002350 [Actinidia rufa]